MERKEAVALLRELVDSNLADPCIVSLKEGSEGKFDLVMKDYNHTEALVQFAAQKSLLCKEDKENGFLVLRKP